MPLLTDEQANPWKAEWKDMPEYSTADLQPKFQILVSFDCEADVEEFGKLINKNLRVNKRSRYTQSIWFRPQEIGRYANKRYIDKGEGE